MTGKDLKVKLMRLDLTQGMLALKLGVTLKTVSTMCNKSDPLPLVWQWAIYGLELAKNKGEI